MGRNEYEEIKLVKENTNIINKSKYASRIEKGTLVSNLFDLCCDYKASPSIFKLLMKAMEEGSCDLNFLDRFLDFCEWNLCRWVTPDGRTDTVGLFLEFQCAVKDIMEKGFGTKCRPPANVNENFIEGRMANIPLLLRYGLGLEITNRFYGELQTMVVRGMVPIYQHSMCHEKIRHIPGKKRVFLVFLVISAFKSLDRITRASRTDASRALRAIWRSIPDSYLSRREFTEIFEGVPVYSPAILQKRIELYEEFVCEDDLSELPQPRSLAHHSRCKVRQALGLRRQLPTGVDALPVPIKIKNYLLLE